MCMVDLETFFTFHSFFHGAGHGRMVAGFSTTCTISAYHH